LSGEQSDVRLAAADDVVGLLWLGDKADGGGFDLRAMPDFFGEWDLLAGFHFDFRVRHDAAGAAIH
jgi:hypothetical protein